MTDTLTILAGDVRETLRQVPENSVHCAITSPPYWQLRSYLDAGHALKGQELGQEKTPEAYIANQIAVFREVRRVMRNDGVLFVNLGDTYGDGDRCAIPERFAFAMQADGWYWRDTIIWEKPSPMPASLTGWQWVRCRVKVAKGRRDNGWKGASTNGKPQGGRAANGKDFDSSADWTACPGCLKCKASDGYVLRRGSWRTTTAHEPIFMFTKSDTYFCDGIAAREPASTATIERNKYSRVTEGNEEEQYAVKHDHEFEGMTRNPRSIWRIASGGSALGHYAMFPIELPKRCIEVGTPAHGVCAECGAPWARVVNISRSPRGDSFGIKNVGDFDHGQAGTPFMEATQNTIGWRATCNCGTDARVPATVLDPFGGSGTTAEAAIMMGRKAILCELNPEYVKIIHARLNAACPLLIGGAS